jgi:hypothetical protein
LYYAMSVGGADVDAGGTHEALIGAGYTIGPGIGLLATVATERAGVLRESHFESLVVSAIGVLAAATWVMVRRGRGQK